MSAYGPKAERPDASAIGLEQAESDALAAHRIH